MMGRQAPLPLSKTGLHNIMRISLNWLKEYIDLDVTPEELAEQMTMLGLEIEGIDRPGEEIQEVYIGQVLSIEQHPDADKIVVCQTDVGGEQPLQICCGARNMKVGDKVPTAVVGATLPGGFQIGRRKMRGVESQGMMCSANELGLGEDHDGLLILDPALPVGADAKPLLGLDDVILEIEVTPNRGDWASMIGVARELGALYGKAVRIPEPQVRESAQQASALSSVTVEDAALCPRYCGRVLTELRVGPSPPWLVRRLLAAGQRPINNIVDITNFVLIETGQPLHAFDYDKLAENRIVVRRAKPGETLTTLDDEQRPLAESMLMIADAERAQCVAGVMGGAESEVGEATCTIFLESASFQPASVRATSRALGLVTESSQRFQRGADPEMARLAIDRAAALMQELAGAEVAAGVIDAYPAPLTQPEVKLRHARANALLGTEIAPEVQCDYLTRLGFELVSPNTSMESITFRVPSWRHDVTQEADLIEEIARLHNFGNIPTTLPRVRQTEQVFAPQEAVIRELRHFLVGLGLAELYNWTFSSPEDVQRAGLDASYAEMVTLENPLSEKYATLRSSLIPGLLHAAAYNINRGQKDIAVFEIGPVYIPVEGEDLPRQEWRLGLLLSGAAEPAHWSSPARAVDFYDLKGHIEALAEHFRAAVAVQPLPFGTFQIGQSARAALAEETVGYLGKVGRSVLQQFDTEGDVFLLELALGPFLDAPVRHAQCAPVPSFPPSLRDLAVLVDAQTAAGALVEAAEKAGGKLLQRVEIFDIYRGEQVPAGKKSVALNLVFQSQERTLTDKDTQKTMNRIVKQLERDLGAVLR